MSVFIYNFSYLWLNGIILGLYYVMYDYLTTHRNKKLKVGDHPGEVAVVTGAQRGIGAEVTKLLLQSGMHVIMGCQSKEEGKKLVKHLREEGITSGEATILPLDLSSLKCVRNFAKEVLKTTTKINYIINNAGMIAYKHSVTEDQFETIWQVNYLGHFLLTHLLLPTLQATPGNTKIVNVSSVAHVGNFAIDYEEINKKEYFDGHLSYSLSKLALVMFTLHLNSQLRSADSNVEVVAAYPGGVNTAILDNSVIEYIPFVRWFFKTPEEGAKSVVYAALKGRGGEYIHNCEPCRTSSLSQDLAEQKRMFEESKKCLGISSYGNHF